jgi:hypothetical protein
MCIWNKWTAHIYLAKLIWDHRPCISEVNKDWSNKQYKCITDSTRTGPTSSINASQVHTHINSVKSGVVVSCKYTVQYLFVHRSEVQCPKIPHASVWVVQVLLLRCASKALGFSASYCYLILRERFEQIFFIKRALVTDKWSSKMIHCVYTK